MACRQIPPQIFLNLKLFRTREDKVAAAKDLRCDFRVNLKNPHQKSDFGCGFFEKAEKITAFVDFDVDFGKNLEIHTLQ